MIIAACLKLLYANTLLNTTVTYKAKSRLDCATRCVSAANCSILFYNISDEACVCHKGKRPQRPRSVLTPGVGYTVYEITRENYGSSGFKLYKEKKTWKEALKACESMGGNLAMPKTKHEYSIIVNMFGQSFVSKLGTIVSDYWLGMSDVHENDTYQWIDGTPLSFTAWIDGDPTHQDFGKEENCVVYHRTLVCDGWKDVPCDSAMYYFCQF